MLNKIKISRLLQSTLLIGILALAGCNNDDENTKPELTETKGLYVLNEGLFNMNNTTLTYYDFSSGTPYTDYFNTKNNRGLGDTGNDMQAYGSKIYIVTNVSSQLEVIDLKTGVSIKQIPMLNENNVKRGPRNIAFSKGFAYICSYDGTVGKLDTASLTFSKFIKVGRNPDGICAANDKLYVSNSGGLDFGNPDTTVSVINTTTFEEIKRINVVANPSTIEADEDGDVYVLSAGNYGDIKPMLQIINSKTDVVIKDFGDLDLSNFTISGDSAYAYSYDYFSGNVAFKIINVKTESVVSENFITDGTKITAPYSINVDPFTRDIFITDAFDFKVTGDVFCFSKAGKLKYKFEAGLNPNSVVFVR